jgi:hypothetical protein
MPHFPELTLAPVSGKAVSPTQQSSRSNFVRAALYGLSAVSIWAAFIVVSAVTRRAGGIMEPDILGSAESSTLTVSRLPESKFSVRSQSFWPIRCSLLRFDQRLADLLPDPDRASQSEVEAPETDGE